jgi:hypothetical protein
MPTHEDERWLPAGEASRLIGPDESTLKRLAKAGEVLHENVHWWRGPHRNSPYYFNVDATREALARRGRLARVRRS